MPDQLQLRGGTTTEHNSFTGVSKEVTVDTTKKTLVVHDGSTAGGTPLMRESGSNGASTVLIGTAGSNALEISNGQDIKFLGSDSTKHLFFDKSEGALGIGTTTPASKLHMVTVGGVDNVIRLDTNVNAARVKARVVGGENHLVLSSNNDASSLVITGSKVGIGPTTPAAGLDIQKDANPVLQVNRGTGSDTNFNILHNGTLRGQLAAKSDTFIFSAVGATVPIAFYANGAERMRLDANGNLGLGVSSISNARFRIKGANNSTTQFDDGLMVTSNNESVFKKYSWTGIETQGGMHFSEITGGVGETMRIDSTGRVGIGTASPSTVLHIANDDPELTIERIGAHSTSSAPLIQFKGRGPNNIIYNFGKIDGASSGVNNAGHLRFFTNASGTQSECMRIDSNGTLSISSVHSGNAVTSSTLKFGILNSNGDDRKAQIISTKESDIHSTLEFGTTVSNSYGERMRIDSSGNVGINNTSPSSYNGSADNLVVGNTGDTGITVASGTSSQGSLFFADGTSGSAEAEGFLAYVHSSNYMMFGTGNTERMRITSTGKVGIGVTSPINDLELAGTFQANVSANTGSYTQTFNVTNAVNADFNVHLKTNSTTIGPSTSTPLCFHTGGSGNERMRITSAGHLLHGCTQVPDGSHPGTSINNDANQGQIIVASNSTGSAILLQFRNPNGSVGDIRSGASATTFNTTSDYRLKENAVSISDGITRLKTLKPYKFNFKSDTSTVVDGFFAHEVTAVPEAVTGTKDAVASEDNDLLGVKQGEPIYQTIDHSKLVPLLTAALQEAISKIETLEAKVAALEAA
jgi:hypothetical protein